MKRRAYIVNRVSKEEQKEGYSLETQLKKCLAFCEQLAAERSFDVPFHEFMADDLAVVRRIYEIAGLPMTEDAKAALDGFRRHNPRGKHGQVVYDLKADFGLDPARVRERFAFYFARFAVRAEA